MQKTQVIITYNYNILLRQLERKSDELLEILWEVLPNVLAQASSVNAKDPGTYNI